MKKRLLLGVALLGSTLLLMGCPKHDSAASHVDLSNPSKTVTLVTPIQFAKDSGVRPAIQAECRLPEKLERFIKKASAQQNILVKTGSGPAEQIQGQVLSIEITRAFGPGGGAYSGAKSVTIGGKLTEGNKVLGTLTARRISGGGAFASFKGTCDILGRDVETLGSDVATFLISPAKGARLGNI